MEYLVIVEIEKVRALTADIDTCSAPDMYAKIKIGDSQHKTGCKQDRITVTPADWRHSVGFMGDDFNPPKKIPIRIQLWDEDTVFDKDDRIDIDPSEHSKSINVLLAFDRGADAEGFRAGTLYLADGVTEVPGAVLRRTEDFDGVMPKWETGTIYSKGCDGDRAEIWYKVLVMKDVPG